jgi:MFS family permease
MNPPINPRAEIADSPLGKFHFRLGALMAAVLFFDGYDLFNGAYAAPYVKVHWQLGPVQLGSLLSVGIIGLALGSVSVGYIADRIGRRAMTIAALWLVSIGSFVLAAVVDSFETFVATRLLLGIGLGMLTPLALTYLNEWTPRHAANRFASTIFLIGFAGGGVAAGLIGIFLAPSFGWRALYWVGSLSIVITLICQFRLPESIQFLSARKRLEEVRAALINFRPDRAEIYQSATVFDNFETDTPKDHARHWSVLRSSNTIKLWLIGALSLFSIHGLTNWLPTVMIARGASITVAFSLGILVMLMQMCGGFATAFFADKINNRRIIIAIFFFCGGSAMLAFSLGNTIITMTVLIALAAFFIFGAQTVLNNFTALSYETPVRATGTGLAVGIARIGGVLGPFVIGVIQKLGGSFFVVFGILCTALILAAILVLLCEPELSDTSPSSAAPH